FRQRQSLKNGNGLVLTQNEAAGFSNRADGVDQVGLGNRDHVLGLDEDVFRGIGRAEDAANLNGRDIELAGRVVSRTRQRDAAPWDAPRDLARGAGARTQSARQRKDLEQILTPLKLVDSGILHRAENRNGLASKLRDG